MNDAARRTLSFFSLGLTLFVAGCGDGPDLFCAVDGCGFSDDEWARLVSLADLPAVPPADKSNAVERNLNAQKLGKQFYFDARFSGVATQVDALGRPSAPARAPKGTPINVSCATCHDLESAGIDLTSSPRNISSGAGWTDVNALATVNSSYQHLYFSNGRVDSQWALATVVAESSTTMNGNRLRTAWVIQDAYKERFEATFGPLPFQLSLESLCEVRSHVIPTGPRAGQCPLDPSGSCPAPCFQRGEGCWPFVPLDGKPGAKAGCQAGDATEPFGDAWDCWNDEGLKSQLTRVLVNWAKAIAAFESQLTSVQSPFDDFMDEGSASNAIDARAQWGARLFVGKAGCFDCHNTPYLSDRAFHNVGVPQVGFGVPTLEDCPKGASCDCTGEGLRCLPWGAYDGFEKLRASKWLRSSDWSDDATRSSPAAALPKALDPALKGAWRTPSLRNVALTAPYMHDGLYQTLEEVVEHYDRGGYAAVGARAVTIRPIGLTADEKGALVAFLRTLTGKPLAVELREAPFLESSSVCP